MEHLSPEDEKIMKGIHILAKVSPPSYIEEFKGISIDGLKPRLERGNLGLELEAS